MKHIKRITKIILTNRVYLSLAIFAILMFWLILIQNFHLFSDTKKSVTPQPSFVMSASEEAAKIAAAPTSGELQYSIGTTYYAPDSKSPKFVVITTEYTDDRLIALNDKVTAELKAAGKIKDSTNSYSINYFDDKKVAGGYFEKLSNPKTTATEKSEMRKSYLATTIYSKQVGFNYIVKIGNATIIKKYER